jgi:hypothetical protein
MTEDETIKHVLCNWADKSMLVMLETEAGNMGSKLRQPRPGLGPTIKKETFRRYELGNTNSPGDGLRRTKKIVDLLGRFWVFGLGLSSCDVQHAAHVAWESHWPFGSDQPSSEPAAQVDSVAMLAQVNFDPCVAQLRLRPRSST